LFKWLIRDQASYGQYASTLNATQCTKSLTIEDYVFYIRKPGKINITFCFHSHSIDIFGAWTMIARMSTIIAFLVIFLVPAVFFLWLKMHLWSCEHLFFLHFVTESNATVCHFISKVILLTHKTHNNLLYIIIDCLAGYRYNLNSICLFIKTDHWIWSNISIT